MSIGRFFHNVFHPFVALFGKIFGEQVRHDFAIAAEELLKSKLGQIAVTVVAELEKLAIPGNIKQIDAFNQIVLAAEKAGLEFKDSFINLLIEVAVQKLKGNA